MRSDLEDIDNVDTVSKAQLTDNNNYALFTIIPEKDRTHSQQHDLRDYHSQAKKYDYGTEISGQSVINIDMSEKLNNAIPVFRRYRCISILLINDCVPFNLSSIKSSTRLYPFINGYIRFHNISHSTWLYG